MSVKYDFLTVGFDKNWSADFGVSAAICDLTQEEMEQLRSMIVVAIGTMERMRYDGQMRKPENQACSDKGPRVP